MCSDGGDRSRWGVFRRPGLTLGDPDLKRSDRWMERFGTNDVDDFPLLLSRIESNDNTPNLLEESIIIVDVIIAIKCI